MPPDPIETVTPPPADPVKSGLLNRLLGLTMPEADAPKPPEEKKPEDAVVTPPPEEKKPEPVVTKPAPVRVIKKTAADKPATRKDLEDLLAKPEPKPDPKVEAKPTGPNVDGLLEEETKEVEIATYAEKKDPKLAGLGSKLADFYRTRNAELERRRAEDPDFDPTSDADFRTWLKKNQPNFSRAQRDTFRELKIKDDTIAEVDTKYRKEMDEMRRKLQEVSVKPAVEQRVNALEREALDALDGDLGAAVKEAGGDLKKLAESHPLEAEVIGKTLRGAQRIAREYLLVQNGAQTLDPKGNPVHGYIQDFVSSMAEQLESAPEEQSVRDGKAFMSPAAFDEAKHGDTHWTFESEDIVAMLRAEALREASAEIARREADAKRLGFTRTPKAAPPGAVAPPPVVTPAAAAPKAAARPSGGPVPADNAPASNALHRLLGLTPPA